LNGIDVSRSGRWHHSSGECLPRHCHAHAFAAIVLRGEYVEAGDQGRRNVAPGDVLIHEAFESHLNKIGRTGAEVIVLPLPAGTKLDPFGRHPDPDAIARLVEFDPRGATELLLYGFVRAPDSTLDWPDVLAAALRSDPSFALGDWARTMNLRPETVSRGFKAAYGVTPAAYRASVRARAAFSAIKLSTHPLADIACAQGFADQAHMTRAIVSLTGHTPTHWRKRSSAIQQQWLPHANARPFAHVFTK
jgi:AraC-like DNA-binding protein